MAASEFTKSCRRKLWFFRILDLICLAMPLLIALILTIFNIIAQKRLRCPIWIILIGLYIAIRNWLLPLVIILAVTSILDDLVFTPLIHYYYTKTVASKTIDEREKYENKEIVEDGGQQ